MLFSTGDVLECTRLSAGTFNDWCRSGVVRAANGVKGTGNHRVFYLMQTVGIAVAAELHSSARGCAPSYIRAVVDAFAAMSETELLKRFDRGATHFVMITQGRPVLDGARYADSVNVRELYRRVLNMAAVNVGE